MRASFVLLVFAALAISSGSAQAQDRDRYMRHVYWQCRQGNPYACEQLHHIREHERHWREREAWRDQGYPGWDRHGW